MFQNCKIISTGVNPAEYHNRDVSTRGTPGYSVSSSDLRMISGMSPSKWKNGFELPASDALIYGSLLDVLVLTPDQFDARYILQPAEYETKVLRCPSCGSVTEAKKCQKCKIDREEHVIVKPWNNNSDTCTSWAEAQAKAGREVVAQQDLDTAVLAKKRLEADPQISALLAACDRQVWVAGEWLDEATGVVLTVRCLIDLVARPDSMFPKTIGDLKSTKNAAVGAWASWARKVGYDTQAAWNLDLFNAATGRDMTSFCFILSESSPPFEIGRRYLEVAQLQPEQDSFSPGRSKYRAALKLYCQCIKKGRWPGYDDTDEASLSGWTLLAPDPWDAQRTMFAPKFVVEPESSESEPAEEIGNDLLATT